MNKIEKLKQIALDYAKDFQKNNNIVLEFEENLNNAEWYIVLQLSQIYYNWLEKRISKEQAKQQQIDTFSYVKNHIELFS